jgi:hypothetical protein
MISIVNTECHVPKTFSDLAKIAAWGRLGQEAENPDAQMRVRDVRLHCQDRAQMVELAGAPLCPIEGHGVMQHEPLNDDEADEGDEG